MQRNILGFLTCALAAPFVLDLSPASAAEGRKPIWQGGTVITENGSYVLTRNLSSTGSTPVIEIMAAYVDLDLNGLTISGGSTATGIRVASVSGEFFIRNGNIVYAQPGVSVTAVGSRVVLEDLNILETTGAGIHIESSERFVLRRVNVFNALGDGILVDGVLKKQGTIESCMVRYTGGTPIHVVEGSNVTLRGNQTDTTSVSEPAIEVHNCTSCLLVENTVHDSGRQGILLRGFTGGKVYNNVVHHAGTHGIHLEPTCSDSLVRDNVITGSGFHTSGGGDGLLVEGDRITIEENTLNGNTGAGLSLGASSSQLTFGRNTARGNSGINVGPCAGSPALFPPNSCNEGTANNTFGNNLIPGPAPF